MKQPHKSAIPAIALAFYAAVIGGAGHFLATVASQSAMNDAAIEAGYTAMDVKTNETRNGGVMITQRHLFSTSAIVEGYLLDQSKNHRLCKYEGATYQLFGMPLFSTTKSLSCAPVEPWPALTPKP